MKLNLFITDNKTGKHIGVRMFPMTDSDAKSTSGIPKWQTSWESYFISDPKNQKYALKTDCGELVALGAYQVLKDYIVVHIVYIESHPESNPTMTSNKKYDGIGKAMIAFGIALSFNNGFEGCVMFEAKTSELLHHYIIDFGAIPLPTYDGPQRLMIDGTAAISLITDFIDNGGDSGE